MRTKLALFLALVVVPCYGQSSSGSQGVSGSVNALSVSGGAMTGTSTAITFPTTNVPAAKYRFGIYPTAQTGTNDIMWWGYNLSSTTFTANTASDAMNWIGLESEYNDGLGHANTMEMYGRFMAAGQSGNNFISAWFANYDKDTNKVLTFDTRSEHTRLLNSDNTTAYLDCTPSGGTITGCKFGVNTAIGPSNPGDLLHVSASGGGALRIQDTTASTGGDVRITHALQKTTFNEYDASHAFLSAPLVIDGATANVLLPGDVKTVATSDFTTSSSTALQTITGLSFVLPATAAAKYPFHCEIDYAQNVAAVSDAFGIQAASLAPTNIRASGFVQTAAGVFTSANLPTLASTTATNIVTFTPSAITTIWHARLEGLIENPSGVANTINIMVSQSTAADTITVKRGSYCVVGF